MACSRYLILALASVLFSIQLVVSRPTGPVDPTNALSGEDLPSNTAEDKDAVLDDTTIGLAYAIGAEASWRALPDNIKCLVKRKYQQDVDISVFVVAGHFDNAEHILNLLRLRYKMLSTDELRSGRFASDPSGKTLIINSGAAIHDHATLKTIKTFVNNGGVLVTSNLAGLYLSKVFPHQKLRNRTRSSPGSSMSAEIYIPTPNNVHAFVAAEEEGRHADDCQRSVPYMRKPAKDVSDQNFRPLWNLEAPTVSISSGLGRRRSRVVPIAFSQDLLQPYDNVVSCFNRRRGAVYHVTGRMFQLLRTPDDELRANNAPVPQQYAQELLRAALKNMDEPTKLENLHALRRNPPSMQNVITASLATGQVLRLLAREWKLSDLGSEMSSAACAASLSS